MKDKQPLISALKEERRDIQLALKEVGYFAYKIVFITPTIIQIEAQKWYDGDEKFIDR